MVRKPREEIFYCKECGNLDYARGYCHKCGSKNIELASLDIVFDNAPHDYLMKAIYVQHEGAFAKEKVN